MINPIKRALKYRGQNLKWLAKKLNVNYDYFTSKVKANNFTLQEIDSIVSILNLKARIVLLDENSDII